MIRNSKARNALALCLALPIVYGYSADAQSDIHEVNYWTAPTPCTGLFDAPPSVLSAGSPLESTLKTPDVQGQYRLRGGAALRLTLSEISKSPVYGQNYAQAYADIFARRPLQDSVPSGLRDPVVLADVNTKMELTYKLRGGPDRRVYQIDPETFVIDLLAEVRMADWEGYAASDALSRDQWDRHSCISLHHELGHILINAQAWEESEADILAITAFSQTGLNAKLSEFSERLRDRAESRQEAYHKAIDALGPQLAYSGPYATLPFEWLSPEGALTTLSSGQGRQKSPAAANTP